MLSLVAMALVGATTASPLVTRDTYPTPSGRQGFNVIANFTDAAAAAPLFPENIQNWCLGGVHVGAGLDTVTLTPCRNGGASLFQNQTVNADGSYGKSALQVPTLSAVPIGFTIDESWVGLHTGFGTPGTHVAFVPQESNYAQILGPTPGHFVVCNVTNPSYGNPQYPVRYVGAGKPVPEFCASVNLLTQCAPLPDAPPSLPMYYWYAQVVYCYDNVAAIDWHKYS